MSFSRLLIPASYCNLSHFCDALAGNIEVQAVCFRMRTAFQVCLISSFLLSTQTSDLCAAFLYIECHISCTRVIAVSISSCCCRKPASMIPVSRHGLDARMCPLKGCILCQNKFFRPCKHQLASATILSESWTLVGVHSNACSLYSLHIPKACQRYST